MSEALDAARKYYSEWFGAFPWKELKISEFRRSRPTRRVSRRTSRSRRGIGFLTKSDPKTNLAFLVTGARVGASVVGQHASAGEGAERRHPQ
jgi:hypothetical protein